MSVTLDSGTGRVHIFDGDYYGWFLSEWLWNKDTDTNPGDFVGSSPRNKYGILTPGDSSNNFGKVDLNPLIFGWDAITFPTYAYDGTTLSSIISQTALNGIKNTHNLSSISFGNLMFVPGRVIYERITNFSRTDSSPDPVLYKLLPGFVSKITKVDFNWCIESQLPPNEIVTVDDGYTHENIDFSYWKYNYQYRGEYDKSYGTYFLPTETRQHIKWKTKVIEKSVQVYDNNTGTYYTDYEKVPDEDYYQKLVRFSRWWDESVYNVSNLKFTAGLNGGVKLAWTTPWSLRANEYRLIGNSSELPYFINDHISEVTIQLRRIKKSREAFAAKNPYLFQNYDWVATISVDAKLIRPTSTTLHSFNRLALNMDAHNKMYGYGDCKITVESDSFSYTKWYLTSDPSNKYDLDWKPTDSDGKKIPKIIQAGYTYYLTIVPKKCPTETKSDLSNPDEPAGQPKRKDHFNRLSTLSEKSSGYMELCLIDFTQKKLVGKPDENIEIKEEESETVDGDTKTTITYYKWLQEHTGIDNFGLVWHSLSSIEKIEKYKWWVRNTDQTSFGYGTELSDSSIYQHKYYRPNPDVKIKAGEVKYGKVVSKINELESKILSKQVFYSDTDSKTPSIDWHLFGFRLVRSSPGNEKKSHVRLLNEDSYLYADTESVVGNQYFSVVPKHDLLMVKGEFFAWFKTDEITFVEPKVFIDQLINTRTRYTPFLQVPEILITNGSSVIKKNVTIYGDFFFDKLSFFIESEIEDQAVLAETVGNLSLAAELRALKQTYVGRVKSDKDLPLRCGFLYRDNNSSTSFTEQVVLVGLNDGRDYSKIYKVAPKEGRSYPYGKYINDLTYLNGANEIYRGYNSSDVLYPEVNNNKVRFSMVLEDVDFSDDYAYQVWIDIVETVNQTTTPIRYYANIQRASDKKDSTIEPTTAWTYPIILGSPTFTNYPVPNPSSSGFWYQIYDGWIKVESPASTAAKNKPLFGTYPYFRRRNVSDLAEVDPPGANQETSTLHSPLHYYPNMVFEKDKNYMISLYTENYFFVGNEFDQGVLYIGLPWGEFIKVNPARISNLSYINSGSVAGTVPNSTFKIPTAPSALTERQAIGQIKYTNFSNINAFSDANINLVSNIIGLRDFDLPQKPLNRIDSRSNPQNPFTITGNSFFMSGVSKIEITEIEWILQGYSPFIIDYNSTNSSVLNGQSIPSFVTNKPNIGVNNFAAKGWQMTGQGLNWFDKLGDDYSELKNNLPVGGNYNDDYSDKKQTIRYLLNNFAAKFIDYENYNISFDYINDSNFGLSIYVGKELPVGGNANQNWWYTNIDELIKNGRVEFVGKLYKSNGINGVQNCEFVGLKGLQYIFFVADPVVEFFDDNLNLSTNLNTDETFKDLFGSTYKLTNGKSAKSAISNISLFNFKFIVTYNDSNNDLVETVSDTRLTGVVDPLYSVRLGKGNNVFDQSMNRFVVLNSKIGNGSFTSGLWKDGVWNSGWREDPTMREFFSVSGFFLYDEYTWHITLQGDRNSVIGFNVNDRVSVSNLAFYDGNGQRNVIKDFMVVVSLGVNSIEVEFLSNSSVNNIVQDSYEHRIIVSRNIWLTGVFLNGHFKGVWNSGLFNGYPLLSKMDQSHWIDGIFNGGHFTAYKRKVDFVSIERFDILGNARVLMRFATRHNLAQSDVISIECFDVNGKSTELGTTVVLLADEPFFIVVGIAWKSSYTYLKNGVIYTTISSGLIQNFDFYANNVSSFTSLESMITERVFKYNSWIDVNYSNQSAVNLGRPQAYLDIYTDRSYSENNLYGYPTADVLSSNSVFRDSFSTTLRKYRLGSKYNKVLDMVGVLSTFEEYFENTDSSVGKQEFNDLGWDFEVSLDRSVDVTSLRNEYDLADNRLLTEPKLFLTFPSETVLNVATGSQIEIYGYDVQINYSITELTIPGVQTQGDVMSKFGTKSTVVSKFTKTVLSREIIYDKMKISVSGWSEKDGQYGPNVIDGWANVPSVLTGNFAQQFFYAVNYAIDRNRPIYLKITNESGLTFSRTLEPSNTNSLTKGSELRINATGDGGKLNLIPVDDVDERTNGQEKSTVPRARYTMVEFDVIDYKITQENLKNDDGNLFVPVHFNNLNFSTRQYIDEFGAKRERLISSTYLPVFNNVNHLLTKGKRKQEFFYNKRNLLMNITGTGYLGSFETNLVLDNLKFYEIDMVPFFQYFKNPKANKGNINTAIQIPKTIDQLGPSPIVDASDESLVDDVSSETLVTSKYSSLIAKNIQVPGFINWEADYSIYKTQQGGGDTDIELF